MIMCKGLLSSVDYVRVESMSPSVESTCCPQHNLTSSNPLPLTPLSYPSLPPLPPSLPLAPYPSSPCPPVPPRPGPVLSFPGMNQSSYCKNFPGVSQSSSAKKRCHIEEESSRPHNDENIFSVRNWIEHNFQKIFPTLQNKCERYKIAFPPSSHCYSTRSPRERQNYTQPTNWPPCILPTEEIKFRQNIQQHFIFVSDFLHLFMK